MNEQDAGQAQRLRAIIAEQAADWLVRVNDARATSADHEALAQWLKASPAHVEEYLNAKATWEAMDDEVFASSLDTGTLLDQAAAAEALNVITLPIAPPGRRNESISQSAHALRPTAAPNTRPRVRRIWAAIAATVGVVAVSAALWIVGHDPNHATYSTATGEQASHVLPDGSILVLNTRSRVKLDWSSRSREIVLEDGEALFQVAHDAARPFRVHTANAVVQAIGTRFDVYRSDAGVAVTVLEGRVEVRSTSPQSSEATEPQPLSSAQPLRLGAGEQARIDEHDEIATTHLTTPERVVEWQQRRLVFDNTSLADAVREFNRYQRKPLVLDEPVLGNKRINGIFDASDRDALIAFIKEFENVDVVIEGETTHVRERRR
jgi:transmembrane sensor